MVPQVNAVVGCLPDAGADPRNPAQEPPAAALDEQGQPWSLHFVPFEKNRDGHKTDRNADYDMNRDFAPTDPHKGQAHRARSSDDGSPYSANLPPTTASQDRQSFSHRPCLAADLTIAATAHSNSILDIGFTEGLLILFLSK